MILGRSDVHGNTSEWVVLDFNPVGSKLIWVYEGVVEQIPHPYRFVENQDVGHSVDRAGNSCCTCDDRYVPNGFVAIGIGQDIALSIGVMHDDGVVPEYYGVGMRVEFHATIGGI
jgi:hypothetical protein